jgi:hypothetical protein
MRCCAARLLTPAAALLLQGMKARLQEMTKRLGLPAGMPNMPGM